MKLIDLKQRLEMLPTRKRIGDQGARFSAFHERAQKARKSATEAVDAAQFAKQALAEFDDKEVLVRARQAGRTARRLHKKLSDNTDAVSEATMDTGFAGLGSQSTSALDQCKAVWTRLIESKLSGRKVLADVVARIPQLKSKGEQMRETVKELEGAASQLPSKEKHAQRVSHLIAEFDALMKTVGLNDEVGEFLREVAGPNGTSINAIEKPKVRAFLDEHKLWSVFRVRLQ
jgi:hypothetical protein